MHMKTATLLARDIPGDQETDDAWMDGKTEHAAGFEGRARAGVSVVIPCFRCGATIGDAVASVAAQTVLPEEVILIDDCSGDGTAEVLRRLASEYPENWIKVIESAVNTGPSGARNAGWKRATQEYIAFLDSDDSWAPRKLELQMEALRADPSIALLAHRMDVRERGVAPPALRPPVRTAIVARRRVLLNNPFPTASVMLRRDLPFRFNENFRRVEDFLLWAEIALSGYRCAKINQTLASYHKLHYGVDGLSADIAAMHRSSREVRRELLRQGLMSWPECCFARTMGFFKRSRHKLVMLFRGIANRSATRP